MAAAARFDAADADEGVEVTEGGLLASCQVDQWRGVRLPLRVPEGAAGSFEVIIVSGLARLGWGPAGGPRVVGNDRSSFGFGGTGKAVHGKEFRDFGESFGNGDRIRCTADRTGGSLRISFAKNGRDLGDAFSFPAGQAPQGLQGAELVATVCGRQFQLRLEPPAPQEPPVPMDTREPAPAAEASQGAPAEARGIGGCYAVAQLGKAALAMLAPDAELRQRAAVRVDAWRAILGGIGSGLLTVGSRQPTGEPVWVTPKVEKGGFAVPGVHMAGGALQDHERALAERLGIQLDAGEQEARRLLNEHFAGTAAGLAELEALLDTGRYRVPAPEEGALLVVAALLRLPSPDGAAEARAILEEVRPWFSKLRFFPVPASEPEQQGPEVFVSTVSQLAEKLSLVQERYEGAQYATMRHSVREVIPLYDSMVSLALETLEHDTAPPALDAAGKVVGGMPFQNYPQGWDDRARSALRRLEGLSLSKKRAQHVKRLASILQAAAEKKLTGRDVSFTRHLLAQVHAARGLPGDPRHNQRRQAQAASVRDPPHNELAFALRLRLASLQQDQGLEGDACAALCDGQPAALQRRIRRARRAPLRELVEERIVRSCEQLARLATAASADLSATTHQDQVLGALDRALYRAFRGRRSLLLLNLASQVRLEELPWAGALARRRGAAGSAQSRLAAELCELALSRWPWTLLPNTFVREMTTLLAAQPAVGAAKDPQGPPLTFEVAADIFEHAFSKSFEESAKVAWRAVKGTCYARYYELTDEDYQGGLYNRCKHRAGITADPEREYIPPALCGRIIEWQQILTTHNLAVLFEVLQLDGLLRSQLLAMAEGCWRTFCRSLCQLPPADEWRPRLQAVKNMAYALRQMLFFLSRLPASEVAAPFLQKAEELARKEARGQEAPLRRLLRDVLPRLRASLPEEAQVGGPVLGWSSQQLLEGL